MELSVFYHHVLRAAEELDIRVSDALARLRAIGIRYVELDRDDIGKTEAEIRAFAGILAEQGIRASSIYGFYAWQSRWSPRLGKLLKGKESDTLCAFRNADRQLRERHLLQAEILGCKRIMLIPGFFSAEDFKEDTSGRIPRRLSAIRQKVECARMISETRKMTRMSDRRGVTVTIEDFDDTDSPVATIQGMRRFLACVPKLRITLDTGNFLYSGEDVLTAQEAFRGKIAHVHLKDRFVPVSETVAEASEQRKKEQDFDRRLGQGQDDSLLGERKLAKDGTAMYACPVGEGCIPIGEVLRGLQKDGYDGIVAIEHFGVPSYAEAIRKSAEWLRAQGIG